MTEEVWVDIAGYEGLYQVSNFGRVKSFYNGGRILKTTPSSNGYLRVALCRDGKRKNHTVHRLVALTFIPNPDGKPEVNHINGVKTDNRAENLEWATATENKRHATVTGLTKTGENHPRAKLTNEQVAYIRANPDSLSCPRLAWVLNVSESTIANIQCGRTYQNVSGELREPKLYRLRLPDDVRNEIRQLYVKDSHEFGLVELAKRFGVSRATVWNIIHEK